MKLERHKDLNLFWKDTKISKDIEKNEKIVSLSIPLDSYGHFETLQLVKCLFFKNSNLESTSNKFAIWNCLFIRPTTIAHPT